MKFVTLAALAALATAVASPTLAATNLGFEDGLTGWTVAGDAPDTANGGTVDVVGATDDYYQQTLMDFPGIHYAPTEGASFARLTAGLNVPSYTTLSQDFHLDGASILSFDVAFLAFDGLSFDPDLGGYDDDGYVSILGSDSPFAFQSSVSAVGDYNSTGWQQVSVLLGPGDYTFRAGIRNRTPGDVFSPDEGYDSQLLLDNISLTETGVPEPASWALMIMGFGSIGAVLRRGRRTPFATA